MQPDAEILKFADVIGAAPQIESVSVEAQMSPVLEGNFADRNPVMPQNTAEAKLDIAPPAPMV
ncbi:MAG: hypothetical protein R3E13_12110 [Alphaproteobacteria bacterium]